MQSNWRKILRELFEYSRPVSFVAPLAIDVCASRLEESIGKRMGINLSRIEGQINKLNDTTYQFRLYQEFKSRRVSVSGQLVAQDKTSTLVDASYNVNENRLLYGLLLVGIPMIVLLMTESQKRGFVQVLAIAAIFLLMVVGILVVSSWFRNVSELVWYIERTLKN